MASLKIAEELKTLIKQIVIDEMYPVNSIYISMDTVSPATKFGGTWVQIKDSFLFCTKTYTITKQYGGASVTGSHALTVDEIPSHMHGRYGKPEGYPTEWIEGVQRVTYDVAPTSNANTYWQRSEYTGGKVTPILKIFLHILLVTLGTERLKESGCYL